MGAFLNMSQFNKTQPLTLTLLDDSPHKIDILNAAPTGGRPQLTYPAILSGA